MDSSFSVTEKVKLIFNPYAGKAKRQHIEASDVLIALKDHGIDADPYIMEKSCDLRHTMREALEQGYRLFVVCGGDGTMSAAAGELAGTPATLAVVPTGSQNNMALSLGTPDDVQQAVASIASARRISMDVGRAICGGGTSTFLETCSVGLISALSSSGEALQHGNLASIGEFLSELMSSEPADFDMTLDGRRAVRGSGHIVLASNLPYFGFHYRVGSAESHLDGLLDVAFFDGLTKIELLKYVTGGIYPGKQEDPRIRHYAAHCLDISSDPAMPVMADGAALGEGAVHVEIHKGALNVLSCTPEGDKA